jgi:hypothetical protein
MANNHIKRGVRVPEGLPDPFPDDPWSWTREVFRWIDGFPGYCVGTSGNVWSRRRGRWQRLKTFRTPRSEGISVSLRHGGSPRYVSVARLVMEAFGGPRPEGVVIVHSPDPDQTNNRIDNLSWGHMGNWKGDDASEDAGRARARRYFVLGPCERCGRPARDRHHVDGVTTNNDPSNIAILCRRCHMVADGRLDGLIEAAARTHSRKVDPQPCIICGRAVKPRRKGRCGACNRYFRVHGQDRPVGTVIKGKTT